MKKKNWLIGTLLAASTLLCTGALTACDGFGNGLGSGSVIYELSGDGTYAIVTDYTGRAGEVQIADTYEGVPVTHIGDYAFEQSNITSIVIPESITSIGNCVFAITDMQFNTYGGCDYIGTSGNPYYAFIQVNDESLTSVTIHESTKVIADFALNISTVIDLYVPSGVISVGEGAFSSSPCIANLTCPINALEALPTQASHMVENFTLTTGTEISDYMFSDWSFFNVVLPDSIMRIGEGAFSNCHMMKTISLGNGVTEIGAYAFHMCADLTNIVIPDSVTSLGYGAFSECHDLTEVVLSNGITSINNEMFIGCRSLESVVLGDAVTAIGVRAFDLCESLTEIVLPNTVTSIGDGAFDTCKSLKKIVIPDSVTSIGEDAFYYCIQLEYVVLGASVVNIGEDAFGDCEKLNKVYYKNTISNKANISIDETGNQLLKNAKWYYYAETEQDLQNDNNNYWHYDENGEIAVWDLEQVFGTEGVRYELSADGTYAVVRDYWGTASDVVLASSYNGAPVTVILEGAFKDCKKLTSIVISDSITHIGNFAFSGCTNLAIVVMGDNVTYINYSSFQNCTSLTEIVLPASVTSIGYGVFENCEDLTKIYYQGTASQWSNIIIHASCNEVITNATKYYYSVTQPGEDGNYWYYDEDGEIAVW